MGKFSVLKPGKAFVYYTGFLLADRFRPILFRGTQLYASRPEIVGTQEEAWKAYEDGLVLLTQRKLSEGKYEYIATRRENEESPDQD